MEHTKSCIVVEGGGFKTGFTSGILDAFMAASYDPFHQYLGVSGGSVALSYFLSQQYRCCLNSILTLAKDKNFLKFTRSLGTKGYMNIDFIAEVARSKVPFEIAKAMERLTESDVYFVATNRNAGIPEYITRPTRDRTKQSWTDYFGSIYFNSNPNLSEVFDKAYQKYNEALEFIDNPPADLKIHQLAPKKPLKSTTYSYSKKSIMRDYRYGLDFGVKYLMKEKHLITT
jgi:predicted patatin/cPLA2 family phospholipase